MGDQRMASLPQVSSYESSENRRTAFHPEDEYQPPEEERDRVVIVIQHDAPLGVGYFGRFLEEVDFALEPLRTENDDPAEIAALREGSIILVITLGALTGGGIAKAGWEVFKHFQPQWLERRRRSDDREHEEKLRREEWARQDRLRREQWSREDRIRAEDQAREDQRRAEEAQGATAIDPRITNIIIIAGGERYSLNSGNP